jgi:hypothetical protein
MASSGSGNRLPWKIIVVNGLPWKTIAIAVRKAYDCA